MELPISNFKKISRVSVLAICCLTFTNTEIFGQLRAGQMAGDKNYTRNHETDIPDFMDTRVNLDLDQEPLHIILDELENQVNVHFSYRDKLLDKEQLFSIHAENISLQQALRIILKDAQIRYVALEGGYIVLKRRTENRESDGMLSVVTEYQYLTAVVVQ